MQPSVGKYNGELSALEWFNNMSSYTKMIVGSPLKFILGMKRSKIRRVVGIITGQNGLNKHQGAT